jgi:N-acetylglucosamine kinase-like BadF-type ATPase/DNA-binding XRE family transcriptional regulator
MSKALKLGKNIKKYRKLRAMTQSELAERIFVTPQNVSKWENGYSFPDVQNLCILADVLDVSLDRLLGRAPDDNCGRLMIGIDGGGSKTEFCLFAEDGSIIKQKQLGGTNPNVYDISTVFNTLKSGIDLLLDGSWEASAIFAGIAGCGAQQNAQRVLDFLKSQYPDAQIEVSGDSLNSIYSTQYYDSCFAVIAGTGSVIFVKDKEKITRIGGWGYLLDQSYNGYYLGCEVLRAVMADEDGIGEPTLLTQMMQKELGGRAVDSFSVIYTKSNEEIAAFTRMLFCAYDEGDAVAVGIIKNNVSALSKRLAEVMAKYPECEKRIVLTGGLTHRRDILQKLLIIPDGASLVFPELPPIYGACNYCVHRFGSPNTKFYETFKNNYREINRNA